MLRDARERPLHGGLVDNGTPEALQVRNDRRRGSLPQNPLVKLIHNMDFDLRWKNSH